MSIVAHLFKKVRMMKPKQIYGLIDPRNDQIRYIGASINPVKRIAIGAQHNAAKIDWLKVLAILGLKPRIDIIEIVDETSDWVERERYWIAYYREQGEDLLNLADGGPGRPGVSTSDETRARMVIAWERRRKRGEPQFTPEGLQRLREKGYINSRKFWDNPTPEGLTAIQEANARGWEKIPPEERSRRATEQNERTWNAYTEEERAERGRGISKGHMSRPAAERSESARAGGFSSHKKDPEAARKRIKEWWDSLTPEQRSEEGRKRAETRRKNRD
jgi:hypothetical protein